MADAVDYVDSVVGRQNLGNIKRVGRVNSRTISLGMFPTKASATWACKKYAKHLGYPSAELVIQTTRDAFRLQPLDPFIWTDELLGIDGMIFRVDEVEEDPMDTDIITIYAHEDIDFVTTAVVGDSGSEGAETPETVTISGLDYTRIIEAPYSLTGDKISIIPLMSKKYGTEMGCSIYMSLDGTTYNEIGTTQYFNPHGTLVSSYTEDTYDIDDTVGFTVNIDSYANEIDKLDSITRAELFTNINTCILDDEIIAVQDFTLVSGTQYECTGVIRGRFDTEKTTHSGGAEFWYVGNTGYKEFYGENITNGSTRYFKILPFTRKLIASISDVDVDNITISGRARKPYRPINLIANGAHENATYSGTGDVVLSWRCRNRGGVGAGYGNPDVIVDRSPVHEGYFTIDVYVSDVLTDTVTGIDALTYTYNPYTELGYIPGPIEFRLTNYITTDGYTFRSGYTSITVGESEGYVAPVADFSADVTSGVEPLSVNFTNNTTGYYDYVSWDFDNDGSVDSTTSGSHVYSSGGTYSVKLTVSGLAGTDSETKTDYITVYTTASAGFSGTPTEGEAPFEVSFTDSSSGDISSWSWDFDNSGSVDSTDQNPDYTYNTPGTYTVKLTVSGLGGVDTETKTNYITASGTGGSGEWSVAAGADDGYISNGNFYDTDTKFIFGELFGYDAANCWMRFTNISIPQGATITGSRVRVVCTGDYPFNDNAVTCTIYANDEDNAVAPTDVSEYNALTTTTGVVWTTTTTWDAGNVFYTPNISDCIQEVVDRPTWSGGAMMILIKGNNNYDYPGKDCASYENATYDEPKLYIDWT